MNKLITLLRSLFRHNNGTLIAITRSGISISMGLAEFLAFSIAFFNCQLKKVVRVFRQSLGSYEI